MKLAVCMNACEELRPLMEAQLINASKVADQIVVVEGLLSYYHKPRVERSIDNEMIQKYNITYKNLGRVNNLFELKNPMLELVDNDINIINLRGVDEFYYPEQVKKVIFEFETNNLVHALVNEHLYITSNRYYKRNYLTKEAIKKRRDAGTRFWEYDNSTSICNGLFEERFFVNNGFRYIKSPHSVSDSEGRFVYADDIYFGRRKYISDVDIHHYICMRNQYRTMSNRARYAYQAKVVDIIDKVLPLPDNHTMKPLSKDRLEAGYMKENRRVYNTKTHVEEIVKLLPLACDKCLPVFKDKDHVYCNCINCSEFPGERYGL